MEKVGIGFAGAGWMGSALMKRLDERSDVEIITLCESDGVRGEEAIASLGLTKTSIVSDYRELLSNPRVQAVFIATPNAFHGQQAVAAMEADKHVFCEKPSSTTWSEHLRELSIAQAKPDIVTLVDYILCFDTFEQRLRSMIENGCFGTISQIQVNYRHAVNVGGNKTWKLKRAMMGDAIGMGINHAISVLLLAMASQARPISVYATSAPAQVRDFEADPIWNILINFSNGAAGLVLGNIDSGNGYDAYHNIQGSRGGLVFDSLLGRRQKVRFWSRDIADGQWIYPLDPEQCHGAGCDPWPDDTTTPDSGDVLEHQTAECVGHFIECVREGRQSRLSFDNTADIAEVGWAAQVSASLGQPVTLPLQEQQAIDVLGH